MVVSSNSRIIYFATKTLEQLSLPVIVFLIIRIIFATPTYARLGCVMICNT